MVANDVPDFVFASTSALYGEAEVVPTPETYSGVQTSLYGAAKLAGEGYASAFAEFSPIKVWAYRFGTVLGERCRRGAIWDFAHKLSKNPAKLEILGQREAEQGLPVREGLRRRDHDRLREELKDRVNIFNLGLQEQTTVDQLADIVIEEMGLPRVKKSLHGRRAGVGGRQPGGLPLHEEDQGARLEAEDLADGGDKADREVDPEGGRAGAGSRAGCRESRSREARASSAATS